MGLQAELEEANNLAAGVRTSEMQRGLRRLAADPYLALALPPPGAAGSSAEGPSDSDLKKAWRRLVSSAADLKR